MKLSEIIGEAFPIWLHKLKYAWQYSTQCELKLVCHKFEYRIRPGDLSWKQKQKKLTKTLRYFLFCHWLRKARDICGLKWFSSMFQMAKTFFSNCFCYFCDLTFTSPCFKTVFKFHCFILLQVLGPLHCRKELKSNKITFCGFYPWTITLLLNCLYSELLYMK